MADPRGRTASGVGLRLLAFWDCGFESHRRHGCLSLVGVVCCQAEVSASGWSLVQSSPIERDVSECDREASIMKKVLTTRGCWAMKIKTIVYNGSTSPQIPVCEFDIDRIVWKNKWESRDDIVRSISGYELCDHKTNGEVRELLVNTVTTKNCGHKVY
jgi:hypothetical protein